MKEHFQVVVFMNSFNHSCQDFNCLSTHCEMSSKLKGWCIDTVMTKYRFILGMVCFSK